MRFLAVIIVYYTLFIGLTESFQASLLRVQHRRSLFLQETSIPNEIIVEPISPIPTLPTSFNIGGLEIDRSRLGIIFTSITSFLSLALSDFVVQCLTKRGGVLSFSRLIIISTFGLWFQGPIRSKFYDSLLKIDGLSFLQKIFSEQILFVPFTSIALLVHIGILSGNSPHKIIHTIRKKIFSLVVVQWLIGCSSHFLNHFFFQEKNRRLYMNISQLILYSCLSFIIFRRVN